MQLGKESNMQNVLKDISEYIKKLKVFSERKERM
jgi:hypothetical protein